MLLATLDVLWPVANVSVFVVEESTDAKLLSGSSVPACPIPGAGCLMPKDSVKPVAVL